MTTSPPPPWKHYKNVKEHYPETVHDHIICDACDEPDSGGFYGVPGLNVDVCWACFEVHIDDAKKKELISKAKPIVSKQPDKSKKKKIQQ
jgi:hypothetical protein